ncbi:MarR family winged helix-turn-helix transcriptional regulator [Nannocystis bainbridge]|uniref:MarR family transcriptional regulator n=1 Tax=Nannocystis bainbridge TaxID=2995303 RepID=A0ABT5E8I8_9BACT|nr:MarR family transcriptional regulator [Nannocystis bainbridge]MDC0722172.1 MarR family transcriptional regulator [Nannocystis bainbridge]
MSTTRTPSGPQDFTREGGSTMIGARLRRLSERIDGDAGRIYAESGIAFEQRWMAPMRLLSLHGPLSVREIAAALGISHASVSQARLSLHKARLISWTTDPTDARSRKLHLTASGRRMVERLAPIWSALMAAAIELDAEAEGTVAALERLDRALQRSSLYDRASAHLRRQTRA